MKKVLLASLISAAMVPAVAMADTKNFEGFSAGLNLNLIHAGFKGDLKGLGSVDGIGGKQTQSASLDFAYGLKIGGTGVLTIGLDVDVSKPKVAEITGENPKDTLSAKQKNRYGIYFAPGTAINKDTLLYGKIGYNKAKFEASGDDGGSASKTFGGASYGAGIKVMVSKDAFIKVEANRYTYSSETLGDDPGLTVKPSATVGTIGFGMKF